MKRRSFIGCALGYDRRMEFTFFEATFQNSTLPCHKTRRPKQMHISSKPRQTEYVSLSDIATMENGRWKPIVDQGSPSINQWMAKTGMSSKNVICPTKHTLFSQIECELPSNWSGSHNMARRSIPTMQAVPITHLLSVVLRYGSIIHHLYFFLHGGSDEHDTVTTIALILSIVLSVHPSCTNVVVWISTVTSFSAG
jgi:hypothetical protein